MEYTPLQPNQAPAFGTSGETVAQYQQQLNQQNAGKPGWTPLAVDGMYGEKTQSASSWQPQNQLIVTGTKPSQQFAENTQYVNQLVNKNSSVPQTTPQQTNPQQTTYETVDINYSDPYTQMLDKISATSDKATQNLIATIKAQKASREQNVNQEYDRLKQGLMSLGIQTGNINFTPDLVYGQIMQAENARIGRLQELDREEATALLEATQASEEKDFRLLKERIDYIKSIKKSRLDLLKESYDTMSYEAKIGELQATQIYDELQKLPEAQKLPFLQEIANRYGIPVTALTSSISQITRDRTEKAKKSSTSKKDNFTLTPTQKNALGGVGFSSEDIDDLLKLVNESSPNEVYQMLKNSNYSQNQLDTFAKSFGMSENSANTLKYNITPTQKNKLIDLGIPTQTIEGIIAGIQENGIKTWEKDMKNSSMDNKLRRSIVKIFK